MIVVIASLNIQSDGYTTFASPGWNPNSDIPQGTKISEKKVVGSNPNYGWLDVNYDDKVVRLAKANYKLEED